MIPAPTPREAKVPIAECAGQRDLADIWRHIDAGRRRFEDGERPRDLAGLEIKPFRFMVLNRPVARFIVDEDRRIHESVGQRLQSQRGEARLRVLGKNAATAGTVIEVFENDRRIIKCGTVIEDQFIAVFNWPLGAALSFIMLAIVLIILALTFPLLRRHLKVG